MTHQKAVAVVGVGAILPDAPDALTFWKNIQAGRYSITDVPPDRWNPADYYDPDPRAIDKTYTKIGAWVRDFKFESLKWRLPIPPKVLAVMDETQQWAIAASRAALWDYGYPDRSLDTSRTAVILGNAMAGEKQIRTVLRIYLPEYLNVLEALPEFQELSPRLQAALLGGLQSGIRARIPVVTEDTMPGELSNIIAGRVANVFDLRGPNFVTDAACASSFAALQSAVEGLISGRFDAVLTGGVERNMGASTFVKFCKIGALSPDGSRPYAEGANGFVMGEGTVIFLLKRLADAERDGDKIYAVIRGIGGGSDGKGKGITAPNPLGPQRAIERAWQDAGVSPATATYIEGHGTSTAVGDVAELQSMALVFEPLGLPVGHIALGSAKSNIGHLKSAAGAVGLLKAVYALHDKLLPPTVNFTRPNPKIDFAHLPFYVNTELRPWPRPTGDGGVRRAGVSAFGFGGSNFHVVLEEYLPGLLTSTSRSFPIPTGTPGQNPGELSSPSLVPTAAKAPYRGILALGADSPAALRQQLAAARDRAQQGESPPPQLPALSTLGAQERLVVDFDNAGELAARCEKALQALEKDNPGSWRLLASQGIFRGRGKPGQVAFLFPGQGSQYVNMLRELRDCDPVIAATFREADEVMQPLLGRPLTDYIFVNGDEAALAQAKRELQNTIITQPAVLTVNVALMRLLESYGLVPDMVIGHSLGEYAALVTAGVLTFGDALQIVSARGREMNRVSLGDNGCMAAISAPLPEVERILAGIKGYVVLANINSPTQSVIGGETPAVGQALAAFNEAGYRAVKIPVSHAFHTRIVAPASIPLREIIAEMDIRPPLLPIVANVTGELYPHTREEIVELLAQQVASPVQFIKGVETLYREGVRVFVEVGPKRVLSALASGILKERDDVTLLFTNHPRKGDLPSFNEALCNLAAAGISAVAAPAVAAPAVAGSRSADLHVCDLLTAPPTVPLTAPAVAGLLTEPPTAPLTAPPAGRPILTGSVVISGVGLGLPGRHGHVFDDGNAERVLRGEPFIEPLPEDIQERMLEKRVTRLVKRPSGATLELLSDLDGTIKLAGQRGEFDLAEEFGVPEARVEALDISTQLAIGAGIEALRDAGIPLVKHYRVTSKGTYLPDRWMLPQALADETGVVFASAFPGLNRMAEDTGNFYDYRNLTEQLETLRGLRALVPTSQETLCREFDERIAALETKLEALDYSFDRRFLFRILAMGHAQFAEHIGARGPNTYVNAACSTTPHAVAIAEDWIRAGRCRRVIVIAGDDVTDGNLMEWIGSGLLATGATTTASDPRKAALPFDRRRNGMIMGMGAAALVLETEDAVRERGMCGICELLASQIANSAFHGTRLDVEHIGEVMERLVAQAERRFGVRRDEIAPQMAFFSHETYTPARGGSAAAEIHALRHTFGDKANRVVITNTKGFTGHTMGVGIEDVLAVKSLETGLVPPIANIGAGFQPDPDLGDLNLSHGGHYPIQYALRLGAGFGSQIAMTLLRRIPSDGERVHQETYRQWLADVAGYRQANLEVVQRTLRIHDDGPPVRPLAASCWEAGHGPTAWAAAPSAEKSTPQQHETHLAEPVALSPAPSASPAPPVPAAVAGSRSVDLHVCDLPTEPPTAPPTEPPADVAQRIVEMIAEQTGYPPEMLDLDLDLEADLGIDTVKQAEFFAAIRETFDIPRREDLVLADYNTLAKVVQFVHDESRQAEPETSAPAPAEAPLPPAPDLPASPYPRRVPAPVLRPRLDLCTPTGVTFETGMRVVVVGDRGKVGDSVARRLRARKVQVLMLQDAAPDAAAAQVETWLAEGPVDGVYFLPALDVEPPLEAMDLEAWHAALDRRVKTLYTLLHRLPGDVFLVCGTRMGGLHGYTAAGASAPLGGAVTGFAKAYAQERPAALVKAVDFAPENDDREIAAQLIEETLRDPAVVEVGRHGDQRFGIGLLEQFVAAGRPLEPGSVFVVTGGAGGITVHIVADLARASRGTFYLTGRTPLPDPTNPDLARLQNDRAGLQRELAQRMVAAGQKPTPVKVERELAALEHAAAILTVLEDVRRAGGTAHYVVCDVTDTDAVARLLQEAERAEGHVDVILHAAGIERSRRLEDKTPEEFARVFTVKADGAFNLLKAMENLKRAPQAVIAFSSVAARFGNAGQTDYSAANDLLCKLMSSLRATHPDIQALALDWSAWAEVGMASRGSIPRIMRRAGIEMLRPEAAASLVRRELLAGGPGGEVVLAGDLGLLTAPRTPDGGLDVARANAALTAGNPPHVMLSHVTGLDLYGGLTLETELDPQAEPFLRDHALNGTPILPGVMGIEGFSVAAQHIASVLGSGGEGFRVTALEDIRFLTALKFYRKAPRRIVWRASVVREASGLVTRVTLESTRALKSGREEHTLHFSGQVYLEPLPAQEAVSPTVRPPVWNGAATVDAEDIYRLYFHGPAFRVLDGVQRVGDRVLGRLQTDLPPATSQGQPLLSTPRLIELCFQTAGIWEAGATGILGLPASIEQLVLYEREVDGAPIYAEVNPTSGQDNRPRFDARVVDAQGHLYLELKGYRTSPFPGTVDSALLQPLRVLVEGEDA